MTGQNSPSNQWPRKDIRCDKVFNDSCLEITMGIADEPDLPKVKALIEPVLERRLVSAGIPGQPGLGVPAPPPKENLKWAVSVDGQRLYKLFHPEEQDTFYKGLRTLEGAIREAEGHLGSLLSGIWQEYLTKQFAREALSDFDYLSFKEQKNQ